MKTKAQERRDGKHISHLYSVHCNKIQVPIMKLPAIYKAGMLSLDLGGSDETIGEALKSAAAAGGVFNP